MFRACMHEQFSLEPSMPSFSVKHGGQDLHVTSNPMVFIFSFG